jgi:hypothetical protein
MISDIDFPETTMPPPRPELDHAGAPRTATSHLQRLEAESIYIMREVAAEFRKPVMLPPAACRHDLEISRDDRLSGSARA